MKWVVHTLALLWEGVCWVISFRFWHGMILQGHRKEDIHTLMARISDMSMRFRGHDGFGVLVEKHDT